MDTSVNAANQVVSVGADIAFDADPKFFACLVRFESSSVPTTLPTAYDVYPLDGRHDGGYYTVKDCFFFQAEAGIRDVAVTGVQTCALPISHSSSVVSPTRRGDDTQTQKPPAAMMLSTPKPASVQKSTFFKVCQHLGRYEGWQRRKRDRKSVV